MAFCEDPVPGKLYFAAKSLQQYLLPKTTCKKMIALQKIADRKVAICFGHLFKDPE